MSKHQSETKSKTIANEIIDNNPRTVQFKGDLKDQPVGDNSADKKNSKENTANNHNDDHEELKQD